MSNGRGFRPLTLLLAAACVTSPSCTPSRNAAITGKYHWELGPGANLHSTLPAEHDGNTIVTMTGRSFLDLLESDRSGRLDAGNRPFVVFGRERHTPAQVAPDTGGYPSRGIRTPDFLYIRNYEPDGWPAGTPGEDGRTNKPGQWAANRRRRCSTGTRIPGVAASAGPDAKGRAPLPQSWTGDLPRWFSGCQCHCRERFAKDDDRQVCQRWNAAIRGSTTVCLAFFSTTDGH